jgi:hypothetical protein
MSAIRAVKCGEKENGNKINANVAMYSNIDTVTV